MDLSVVFMPHPPVIVPEVGGGQEKRAQKTIDGMIELSKLIGDYKPETIIIATPHGNSFSNGTCILDVDALQGNFSIYGASNIQFKKKVNRELSRAIYEAFEKKGFVSVLMDDFTAEMYQVNTELENGAMVASYYIDKYYKDYDIVHITPGFTSLKENYELGKCIRDVVDSKSEKVLMLCSGDLSHALKSKGPYNYHPSGPTFDKKVKEAIEDKDPIKLLILDEDFIEEAAQCGLRSFLMGFGYVDGKAYNSKVLSYEGPFGVGYLTGYFFGESGSSHSLLDEVNKIEHEKHKKKVLAENDYVKLARKSIEHYVLYKKKLNFDDVKEEFTDEFIEETSKNRAGVFISIHSHGALRGCIGTIEAVQDNVIEEIIQNGISACSYDPRFLPVEADELDYLDISVDVLMEPEEINSKNELDVKKYGVIVSKGNKKGVLLPNLDGVDTVDEQIRIAKDKAGITDEKGMKLYRFEVIRYG